MTKAEGTVTLRSVNEDTGEIKEGSCIDRLSHSGIAGLLDRVTPAGSPYQFKEGDMDVIEQARKVLEEVPPSQLGKLMGLRETNFPPLKSRQRPLTENMALRIVAAAEGKPMPAKSRAGCKVNKGFAKGVGAKAQPLKPSLKKKALNNPVKETKAEPTPGRTTAFVTGDHPAWDIIERYAAAEIAEKCGVSVKSIEGIEEGGLRPKLANLIVLSFKDRDEERMKDALRSAATSGDSEAPQMRTKPEQPEPEPPSASPVKTWIDESLKKPPLSPSFDFLKSLLAVGGYIIVPITPELVDKLKGA